MKKFVFCISIFLTFTFTSISFAKWGKGELKFEKETMEYFLSYLYGGGNEQHGKRSDPLIFTVAEDGNMAHYFFCPWTRCKEDSLIQKQSEGKCEKHSRGSPCFTFAIKRRIVWKNGGPKIKIKKKDLASPYVIAKKLQEGGFYDGDISQLAGIDMKTGKIDNTITITGEKRNSNTETASSNTPESSTDIVEQLESLKKLYESGVLSEEEFTKAKNKLLGQ